MKQHRASPAWKLWLIVMLTCAVLAISTIALRQLRLPPAAPEIEPLPVVAPEPQPVTLTFVGDIMLAGRVGKAAQPHGLPDLFTGVQSTLTTDDLTIGNLECAVSTRGVAEKKTYVFRADPALLTGLRESGVEAVTLANNHALDFGRQALRDTLEQLRAAGITPVGAGADANEAYRPAFLPVGTVRVALLGASHVLPSTRWYAGDGRSGIASAYDPARLLAEIRLARANAELVIVYLHWGREREIRPAEYQRVLAQQCIDAGADLVAGSHPHVLQGFEYYRSKLIIYSLGNFIFNNRTASTMMVQTVFLAGRMQSATVIPCTYAGYRPRIVTEEDMLHPLLAFLRRNSFGVSIGQDGALRELSRQPAGDAAGIP